MMRSRRSILQGGLVAGGSALWSVPAAARRKDSAGPTQTALQTFVRIRCSEAERRTTWWYSGYLYGRVGDAPLQPLMTIVGVSQTIGQWLPDGSYAYDMVEAGYYGDVETGLIADAPVTNHLTGEHIQPVHYLSPQKLTFTPDLNVVPARAVDAATGAFSGTITPPDEKGGRIWMAENLLGQLFATTKTPARVFNSMANFEASAADVRARTGFVPASMQYTTLNSFRPWMLMQELPGSIMTRLNAVKLDKWRVVPGWLRERVIADHTGVFFDA